MTIPHSLEETDWWALPQPTDEELYASGGLWVEDWPHARQVARLSDQLFEATLKLHKLDSSALRLLERAAFLHNTGMMLLANPIVSTNYTICASLQNACAIRLKCLPQYYLASARRLSKN